MGAIIGGLYAAGVSPSQLEDYALRLTGKSVLKLFSPAFTHSGFFNGANIVKYLKTLIPDRDIETLALPFKAVATDFFTGAQRVLEKGSLFEALRASSSIPVIFTSSVIDGKIMLDGGLSNPLPTSIARNMGADIVLSVNVVPPPEYKKNIKSIKNKKPVMGNLPGKFGNWKLFSMQELGRHFINIDYSEKHKILPNTLNIFMQTQNIIEYNLLQKDFSVNKPDFLLEPNHDVTIGWFEFARAKEIIKNGEKSASVIVDDLKKRLY
jgi:NTE family protein